MILFFQTLKKKLNSISAAPLNRGSWPPPGEFPPPTVLVSKSRNARHRFLFFFIIKKRNRCVSHCSCLFFPNNNALRFPQQCAPFLFCILPFLKSSSVEERIFLITVGSSSCPHGGSRWLIGVPGSPAAEWGHSCGELPSVSSKMCRTTTSPWTWAAPHSNTQTVVLVVFLISTLKLIALSRWP